MNIIIFPHPPLQPPPPTPTTDTNPTNKGRGDDINNLTGKGITKPPK